MHACLKQATLIPLTEF